MSFFSFQNVNLYIAIVLSVINGVLMCFASYKFFQIIQLSGYKLKGYFKWMKDTKGSYASRMVLLSLLSIFCVLVTNALFDVYHTEELYSYIGLIFYFYFTIVFIVNLYHAPKKTPLKYTTRMTRLNVAMFVFVSLFSFIITALSTEYLNFLKFGAICLVPLFVPLFVPFVHIILLPLEKIILSTHVSRARKKLKKCDKLIKIGITGSFGKTSTKYILNTILSVKYKVCMSPHSFNTLPGLSKVVNNYLNLDDEILIAEMGARNVGDIKQLCDLICPKYGIITGVGTQHLESFKTEENILKTKFELIESLPKDGIAIFNGFDSGAKKLYDRCDFVTKKLVGNNEIVNATNITYDENGTTFDLIIKNKVYEKVKTTLIGEHNVENIVLCVELAKDLGVTDKEILTGISMLKPIPHRLELIKTGKNLILDDAYNASVNGTIVALNVLSKMPGRKVVITPGIIELGTQASVENENFGKRIAKVADIVVIVNKLNFDAIKKGLDEEKFNEENLYQADSLDSAKILMKDFLREEDSVLFENDLPDNYI